jgi:hypothetical protein
MKNKTLAAWLAFLGGPLGLHRFYLHGLGDPWGWLLPIPTALGARSASDQPTRSMRSMTSESVNSASTVDRPMAAVVSPSATS